MYSSRHTVTQQMLAAHTLGGSTRSQMRQTGAGQLRGRSGQRWGLVCVLGGTQAPGTSEKAVVG